MVEMQLPAKIKPDPEPAPAPAPKAAIPNAPGAGRDLKGLSFKKGKRAREEIAERPSIKFGPERMLRAQAGTLSRESLEASCLSADGEDYTTSSSAWSAAGIQEY